MNRANRPADRRAPHAAGTGSGIGSGAADQRPRFDGVLTRWDPARGFGFIEPLQGGERIFVHISAFGPGAPQPQEQQPLTFEVERGPQGKKRATRVQSVRAGRHAQGPLAAGRPARRHPTHGQPDASSYVAIAAFLLVYLAVALLWRVPGWVAGWYVGASVLCFVAYAMDKAAARAGGWRISENQLLLLGLACGWPGAVVAQQVLRHKSRKQPFRTLFWTTVAANMALFVVLRSPWARSGIGG